MLPAALSRGREVLLAVIRTTQVTFSILAVAPLISVLDDVRGYIHWSFVYFPYFLLFYFHISIVNNYKFLCILFLFLYLHIQFCWSFRVFKVQ